MNAQDVIELDICSLRIALCTADSIVCCYLRQCSKEQNEHESWQGGDVASILDMGALAGLSNRLEWLRDHVTTTDVVSIGECRELLSAVKEFLEGEKPNPAINRLVQLSWDVTIKMLSDAAEACKNEKIVPCKSSEQSQHSVGAENGEEENGEDD